MVKMKLATGVSVLAVLIGVTFTTDCPDRWIAFDSSCYLIGHQEKVPFLEGEVFCRQIPGAHLVHVDSMKENEFLKSEFRMYKNDSFWMGLSDMKSEGNWTWYDSGKSTKFLDWYPGEPNSYRQEEDCAIFWEQGNFEWADAPCYIPIEPVCELS